MCGCFQDYRGDLGSPLTPCGPLCNCCKPAVPDRWFVALARVLLKSRYGITHAPASVWLLGMMLKADIECMAFVFSE
jgi:hypothetical protein